MTTTANSVYEASKQRGESSGSAPAPKTQTPPAAKSYWGGTLPKGTLVNFQTPVHGVGTIDAYNSSTKTYGIRWGEDKVTCHGYKGTTLVPLTADESAEYYITRYEVTSDIEDTSDFFSKEVAAIEEHIKRLNTRLESAKAVKESYRREKQAAKPPVAVRTGGW